MSRARDTEIVQAAANDDRIIISADTDFDTIQAVTGDARPSIVLIRRSSGRRAAYLTALVLANLKAVGDALIQGAVVVLDNKRLVTRPPGAGEPGSLTADVSPALEGTPPATARGCPPLWRFAGVRHRRR